MLESIARGCTARCI